MFVYLITNKLNGKQYVGQSTCKRGPDYYWKLRNLHLAERGFKTKPYLFSAIRKYGRDAFEFEVLVTLKTKAELDLYEKLLIKCLVTKAPSGYNLTNGGEGSSGMVRPSEIKERIRTKLLGHSVSKITRQRISVALKGKPKPARSEVHCQHLSEAKVGTHSKQTKPRSPEHCEKISQHKKRYWDSWRKEKSSVGV